MDLIDLWWNSSQQSAINDLRLQLNNARANNSTNIGRQSRLIELLQQENDDLRLRVGVLIRLLIQQGAISAEQYAAAVKDAKASIAHAQAETRTPARPAPAPRPKPPKLNQRKPI